MAQTKTRTDTNILSVSENTVPAMTDGCFRDKTYLNDTLRTEAGVRRVGRGSQ